MTSDQLHENVAIGDLLPTIELRPISRLDLALYAGASGDHNPIHIDPDFARGAGLDDVFAHGMLSMAYLGRLLTRWAPQELLRRFDARFLAITHLGDPIVCSGRVVELLDVNGEKCVRVALQTSVLGADPKILGEAVFAIPKP